ncbi:MAG: hypothetical protein KBD78_16070 [Oligoflexales bacterium]|nr:hypothetical protein [Oligoflexales bacterium]
MKNRILKLPFLAVLVFSNQVALSQRGPSTTRKGVRIVYLDEMAIAPIKIHSHGTVLSFPVKPEVHVGKQDVFDIVYVRNDLVISARQPNAITNIFIYMLGRRFTLKLVYTPNGGDEIVAIRDPKEATLEVEVK